MIWLLVLLVSLLSSTFSRLALLAVGALFPAYASCKAVRSRNPREYTRWMMYWIVTAGLFSVEPFLDAVFSSCLPLYSVLKIAFVVWLQSRHTRGASLVFQKIVLPQFIRHEEEIDYQLSCLHARASEMGTSAARYVTHRVMYSASGYLGKNCSVTNLAPLNLKFGVQPLTDLSTDDMLEMATGDQEQWMRSHLRHADDDAEPKKLKKISSNLI